MTEYMSYESLIASTKKKDDLSVESPKNSSPVNNDEAKSNDQNKARSKNKHDRDKFLSENREKSKDLWNVSSITMPNIKFENRPQASTLRDDVATASGHGMVGNQLQSIDKDGLVRAAILSGQIPIVIAKTDDLRPVAASSFLAAISSGNDQDKEKKIRAFSSECIVVKKVVTSRETKGFEKREFAELHSSNAFGLLLENEVAATIGSINVAEATKASYQKSSSHAKETKSRTLYMSSVYNNIRLSIRVPSTSIRVPPDVEKKFRALLRDIKQAERDTAEQAELIEKVLSTAGAMVPLVYHVGGRLKTITTTEEKENLEKLQKNEEQKFVKSIGGGKGPVAGSVGGGITNTSESGTETQSSSTASEYRLFADGGDATLVQEPLKWLQSLDDYSKLAIIGYEDLIPIWECFTPDLRKEYISFTQTMKTIYKNKISRTASKLQTLKSIDQDNQYLFEGYGRILKKMFSEMRNILPRDSWTNVLAGSGVSDEAIKHALGIHGKIEDLEQNISQNCVLSDGYKLGSDVAFGVPGIPGCRRQEYRFQSDWKLVDLARVQKDFKALPGNLFTYVKIYTSFDPPAMLTARNGFLLGKTLDIECCQYEKLKGLAWQIVVEDAPEDNIFPNKDHLSDIIFYDALKNEQLT